MDGFERLQLAQHRYPEQAIDEQQIETFLHNPQHSQYLQNEQYHRYLRMHKVALGNGGHETLLQIAHSLEQEYMPTYIDAAAWSYAELAMFQTSLPQEDRLIFLQKADSLWSSALHRQVQFETTPYSAIFDEHDESYRIATSLAFVPLMESLIHGDVDSATRRAVMKDVSNIALSLSDEVNRMYEAELPTNAKLLSGLQHELNTLLLLLYCDDPKHVPMPATARADSGYYHREQTHDISIINQHWGKIKKVVAVEVKASPTRKDRLRYNALIIRGKMYFTPDGRDPGKTASAMYAIAHGEADLNEMVLIERLSGELKRMLDFYQKGGTHSGVALNSLTRFYDRRNVAREYPGLAV
jgi:hypothetical protein